MNIFIPFLHRAISQATALPGVEKYFPIDSNLNHVQARRFFFFTFPSLLSFVGLELYSNCGKIAANITNH